MVWVAREQERDWSRSSGFVKRHDLKELRKRSGSDHEEILAEPGWSPTSLGFKRRLGNQKPKKFQCELVVTQAEHSVRKQLADSLRFFTQGRL